MDPRVSCSLALCTYIHEVNGWTWHNVNTINVLCILLYISFAHLLHKLHCVKIYCDFHHVAVCCVEQAWSKLLSPVSEFLPRSVNMLMAVPTVYAKLIDDYDKRLNNSDHSRDYIKTTCSSKIRYFSQLTCGFQTYSIVFFIIRLTDSQWVRRSTAQPAWPQKLDTQITVKNENYIENCYNT